MTVPTKPNKATSADTDNTKLPAVVPEGTGIVPSFPGENPTSDDPVNYFASAIRDEWRKSVESILMVAKLCARARKALDYQQRERLYRNREK